VAFGRKGSAGDTNWVTATVAVADHPLDGKLNVGQGSKGEVRIVVETGADPIYTARKFKLDKSRWLVPSQEIQVSIDPKHPDKFDVNWDAIPSIEDRIAAGDRTLIDPLGARRRTRELIAKVTGGAATDDGAAERFVEAIKRAEQETAPPGKQRAVALTATRTVSLVTSNRSVEHIDRGNAPGGNDTVLAVNVPGSAPYAVYVKKLKRPRAAAAVKTGGIPALVSSTDPNDVELLWSELPSVGDQIGDRISQAMGDIKPYWPDR
jgi:hypothetical protein